MIVVYSVEAPGPQVPRPPCTPYRSDAYSQSAPTIPNVLLLVPSSCLALRTTGQFLNRSWTVSTVRFDEFNQSRSHHRILVISKLEYDEKKGSSPVIALKLKNKVSRYYLASTILTGKQENSRLLS